jgi:hypothetical protein
MKRIHRIDFGASGFVGISPDVFSSQVLLMTGAVAAFRR